MNTSEHVTDGSNDLVIALDMYRRASEEGFRQKARAEAAEAKVARLEAAVRDVLTWDHERGRPIPRRHRDPLLRALAALRGEGQ